jgi:hypothetical protein
VPGAGQGGAAGAGDLAFPGNDGGGGAYNPNASTLSSYALNGYGGAGPFGGSPNRPTGSGSGTGVSAPANSGSGGAGGITNQNGTNYGGGNGGSGVVIITEFVNL